MITNRCPLRPCPRIRASLCSRANPSQAYVNVTLIWKLFGQELLNDMWYAYHISPIWYLRLSLLRLHAWDDKALWPVFIGWKPISGFYSLECQLVIYCVVWLVIIIYSHITIDQWCIDDAHPKWPHCMWKTYGSKQNKLTYNNVPKAEKCVEPMGSLRVGNHPTYYSKIFTPGFSGHWYLPNYKSNQIKISASPANLWNMGL